MKYQIPQILIATTLIAIALTTDHILLSALLAIIVLALASLNIGYLLAQK